MPRATLCSILVVCSLPAFAADSAHFRADLSSLPIELSCGDTADVVIVMQNTGTTTWGLHEPACSSAPCSTFADYKLGEDIPAPAPFQPGRSYYRASETTAPSALKRWTFQAAAGAIPGLFSLNYRMILESSTMGSFFGEAATSSVRVHAGVPLYLSSKALPPGGFTRAEETTDTGGFPAATTQAELRWAAVPCADRLTLQITASPSPGLDPLNSCTPSGAAYSCRSLATGTSSIDVAVTAGTSYSWQLTASDSTGSYASSLRQFFVQKSAPETSFPSGAVVAPANGSTVSGVVPISLDGSLYSDLFGYPLLDALGISRLQVLVDNLSVSDQSQPPGRYFHPPFLYPWDTSSLADGSHSLQIIASNPGGYSLLTSLTVTVSNNPPGCLAAGGAAGDDATIQAALAGVGSRAVLCPDTAYYLKNTINLTASDQEIFTKGNPTGSHRARLVVSAAALTGAVVGYAASRARMHHLVVEGSRGLGPWVDGPALLELGGQSQDQVVDHVKLSDPRSWSALHFIEGDRSTGKACARAVVTNNDIGPAGFSSVDALGSGQWGDGISLDCNDSYVSGNTITDATDGGIVLFASPRSLVMNNLVRNLSRIAFGGINLVDFLQYRGDYHGTVVTANTLDAEKNGGMRGALSQGAQFGCPGTRARNFGASIVSNTITGPSVGFGMALNGVFDWTVSGNLDSATHGGVPQSCDGSTAPAPAAFIKSSGTSDGSFQAGFVEGAVSVASVDFGRGDSTITSASGASSVGGPSGSWFLASYFVPAGAASLTMAMRGGTGDGDLYLQRGGPPTENEYLCRPYLVGNNETCTIQAPQPGIWYVGVRGYSDYGGASLALSFGSTVTAGAPLAGLGSTQGSQALYSLQIPPGVHFVSIGINGGFGDADLYLKVNGVASTGNYDCVSAAVGNKDSCGLQVSGPALVSIDVYGYREYAGVTLTTSVQ